MHTHIGSVHRLECVHMCARGAVLGAFGRAARTHRPDDGAIPILGAHGCAQTERSPRRERPLPRTQHTRRRRREWAKSGASVGALRSRLARTAVGVHARRSLDAADSVRWSRAAGDLVPGEKCGTPRCSPTSLLRWVERRQRQRREPRGECGVHNTRACVHIRHGESGCGPYRRKRSQPTPDARERNVRIPQRTPGPLGIPSHPISLIIAVLHHVGLEAAVRFTGSRFTMRKCCDHPPPSSSLEKSFFFFFFSQSDLNLS